MSDIPPSDQMRAACKTDNVQRVQELLSACLHATSTSPEDWVTGRSPLVWSIFCAVQDKAPNCLRYLLDNGADVSEIYPDSIRGALDGPVGVSIVQMLLDHGWDINSRKQNKPPLLWIIAADPDKVNWCIDHGSSLELRPVAGESDPPVLVLSLLETIASRGSLDTFKAMMARGAPLGKFPRVLHVATRRASSAGGGPEVRETGMTILKYLLEDLKCDPNQIDQSLDQRLAQRRGTPLCYIAAYDVEEHRTYEVIRLLMPHGADPGARNSFGQSCLDLAMDEDIDNVSFVKAIESIQTELKLAHT